MAWKRPDYPRILTAADWKKQKGVIAKLHGKTGIGEQMEKCVRAYGAVNWEKLEISENRARMWNSFTMDGWNKVLKEAKSEVGGNLRKLVESLYALRDLAKKAAADFKKSKTIGASSRKHVEEIQKTADQLGLLLNANSIGGPLMEDWQEQLDRIQQVADGLPKILQKVLKTKVPAAIKEAEKDPTPEKFNSVICKTSRDITQNLTNIVDAMDKRGLSVDGVPATQLKNLQALSQILVTWGNAKSGFFKPDDDPEKVKKEVAKFKLATDKLRSMFG